MNFEYPDGATPIDPDEAEGLLLAHITTRGELDRWEQENILEALAWLEKKPPRDILNETFLKQLHLRMFRNVWRWAGKFRQSDKNIGGSWMQIPMAVRNLCDDARLWLELQNETADQMAARFHHRLVTIHPFANGNGRLARLMTDLFLETHLHSRRFSWGGKSLSGAGDLRNRYILALRAADGGNYQQLCEFVRS